MKRFLIIIMSFCILFLIITILGVVDYKAESADNFSRKLLYANYVPENVIKAQNAIEMTIAELKCEFLVNWCKGNVDGYFHEHVLFEKFDEFLQTHEYRVCLKEDIDSKPENLICNLVSSKVVYFTDGKDIFSINFGKLKSKRIADIYVGDVKLIK